MRQIAIAAGHGYSGTLSDHPHLSNGDKPWFNLDGNSRPSYDLRFIQLFNPDVVEHLLDRLDRAESGLVKVEEWRTSGPESERRLWRVRPNDDNTVSVVLFHGPYVHAEGTGQDAHEAAQGVLAQISE